MRATKVILVSLVLLIAVLLLGQYFWQIKIPKRLFLGQLSSGINEIRFVAPRGSHYNLVIGLPTTNEHTNARVIGTISLTYESNKVVMCDFDTSSATSGNWLRTENLNTAIIIFSEENLDLELSKRSPVSLRIIATGTNVEYTSLWLCYLEKWVDKKLGLTDASR